MVNKKEKDFCLKKKKKDFGYFYFITEYDESFLHCVQKERKKREKEEVASYRDFLVNKKTRKGKQKYLKNKIK